MAPILHAKIELTAPGPLTLRVSDRYLAPSGAAIIDEERDVVAFPLVQAWGDVVEGMNPLDAGAAPATFDLTLFNAPIAGFAKLSDLIAAYEFTFAKLTLYRRDAELGIDEVLGVFFLEDPAGQADQLIQLRASDLTLKLEDRAALTKITTALFPSCAPGVIDLFIPRMIGTYRARGIPVVDGQVGELGADMDASQTFLDLVDASRWGDSGTGQVEVEQFTWDGKLGNRLLNVVRGVGTTTAIGHGVGTDVLELREVYRFAFGEHSTRFRPLSIVNVKVGGAPARTSPALELDATDVVSGKRFTVVSFTAADMVRFHQEPLAGLSLTSAQQGSTSTWDPMGPGTSPHLVANATLPAITTSETGQVRVSRRVTLTFKIITNGGINSAATFYVGGRLFGSIALADLPPLNTPVTVSGSYETGSSLATEAIQCYLGATSNSSVSVTVTLYQADVSPQNDSPNQGGTASKVIPGEVTADVVGIVDDGYGTITGTPGQLLYLPHDVVRYAGLELFGLGADDFDPRWPLERAIMAGRRLRWDGPLGEDGLRFSEFRRLAGAQARSTLFTEAGRLVFKVWPDAPAADFSFDRRVNIAAAGPAETQKTSPTQLYNAVVVLAKRNLTGGGDFGFSSRDEDLTQPGLEDPTETRLECPFVQDTGTAIALRDFWLRWWKRQRWQVDLITWTEALALEKGDCFVIVNHPVLPADLVFRAIGKDYRLSDDANPAHIRIRGIEAAL